MSGGLWAYVGLVALALVLPVAALRHSRMSRGTMAKMTAAWLALFIVATLAFSSLGR